MVSEILRSKVRSLCISELQKEEITPRLLQEYLELERRSEVKDIVQSLIISCLFLLLVTIASEYKEIKIRIAAVISWLIVIDTALVLGVVYAVAMYVCCSMALFLFYVRSKE